MSKKTQRMQQWRQQAIRKNAADQESIKLKLADLYEQYFFISNSPWLVRFLFCWFFEKRIAQWEYTLIHKKTDMISLVNPSSKTYR